MATTEKPMTLGGELLLPRVQAMYEDTAAVIDALDVLLSDTEAMKKLVKASYSKPFQFEVYAQHIANALLQGGHLCERTCARLSKDQLAKLLTTMDYR